MENSIIEILKIFVLASILFVWVVRYGNIVEEFKFYGYPNWLRDIVGIFKIAFAVMLFNQNILVIKTGAIGISILMICALITHLKVKNPIPKMFPSAILLTINVVICMGH
jgi:hypothetical protein